MKTKTKTKLTHRGIDGLKPKSCRYDVADTEVRGLICRVLPSGFKGFLLRYRSPETGRWTRTALGDADTEVLTVEQARQRAVAKLSDIHKGVDPVIAKRAKNTYLDGIPTLEQFLDDEYEPQVLAFRKSGKETMRRLKQCFRPFLARPLNTITKRDVDLWWTARLKDGRTASTVNRDLTALKAVLAIAVDRDILPAHPLRKVKPLNVDRAPRVRYLGTMKVDDKDVSEEAALLKALDWREASMCEERRNYNEEFAKERGYPRRPDLIGAAFSDYLKPLVLTLLHTGIRRGEAFSLTWADVDLDALHPQLTVKGATAKSGQTRIVPLNSVAVDTLKKWKKQTGGNGLVFPSPKTGGRMDNIQTAWERVVEDAGIKEFVLHSLRHSFASKLVMAGVDLNTVRELLGHSTIAMTLKYAHLAPQTKALAVEKIVGTPKAGNIVPYKQPETQTR